MNKLNGIREAVRQVTRISSAALAASVLWANVTSCSTRGHERLAPEDSLEIELASINISRAQGTGPPNLLSVPLSINLRNPGAVLVRVDLGTLAMVGFLSSYRDPDGHRWRFAAPQAHRFPRSETVTLRPGTSAQVEVHLLTTRTPLQSTEDPPRTRDFQGLQWLDFELGQTNIWNWNYSARIALRGGGRAAVK